MAHFAEINKQNIVTRVFVVPDEQEHRGQEFLANDLGLGGTWLKTSYNTVGGVHLLGGVPFRKNYAGEGFMFDSERDAFIPPAPYPSWLVNEDTCLWEPPILYPQDGQDYYWNEQIVNWSPVNETVGDTNIVVLGDE